MHVGFLIFSIGLALLVMAKKRISPVSLYTLFGLQWFFYLIFPLLMVSDLYPKGIFGGYPLNYDKEIIFYFILFNALAMIVFSLVFLCFYKRPAKDPSPISEENAQTYKKYREPLFWCMVIINILLLFLSLKYRHIGEGWATSSINGNLRNVLLALFLLYMLIRPAKIRLYMIILLFCISTLIYGGRVYLLIMATSFFFYYYDIKIFKFRHIVALFLVSIFFLTTAGLIRAGQVDSLDKAKLYMMGPMFMESVYSSYPGLALIDLWLNNKIKYHNFFASYIIDPFIIFVPQFIFVREGAAKGFYNVLGQWEQDHGGREHISPQGGYYYMAEAMQALSVPGIFLVVFLFAIACVNMDKLKYGTLMQKFIYYNFVGTVGLGFVSDQFAWCIRSFGMNMIAILLFMFAMQLLDITPVSGSAKKRLWAGRSASARG